MMTHRRPRRTPFLLSPVFIGMGIFLLIGAFIWWWPRESTPEPIQSAPEESVISAPAEFMTIREVEDGDTFTRVMEDLGLSYGQALEILSEAEDIYDFTSIRIGRIFRMFEVGGRMDRIEYDIDTEEMVTIHPKGEEWEIVRSDIQYETEVRTADVYIKNSLFADGVSAGVSETLILSVADVLAWSVDFATQVQQGDSMRVLYEKRFRDGEEAGEGNVLAVIFTNSGEESHAYYYEDAEGNDGYYDQEGNAVIRPFLKAPLRYSRVTSGFTYARFHPVLQRNTPHRAIDYAAPYGTPIHATANGTVTFAGWNGGYGNYIDIHHNDVYETQYAHLSRYADGIRKGTKVSQGQVIGYVGSTGFSTGPHLHYQIKKNGTLVDPTKIDLPKGDPLLEQYLDDFTERRNGYLELLNKKD